MARQSCRFFLATVISLSVCMPIQSVLAQEPFYRGKSLPQILGGSGVRFDNNMPMIVGVGETSVVYIGADTGVKRAADILKPLKPIVIGGFTRESNKDLALRMALDLLGVPYRYVTGYAGESDLRLAIQRGEINYTSEGLTGLPWVAHSWPEKGLSFRSIRMVWPDPRGILFATRELTSPLSGNSLERSKTPSPRAAGGSL